MKRRGFYIAVSVLAVLLCASAYGETRSELCERVDQKPVLSFQQVTQAELIHYLVVIGGLTPPSPEGKSPEELYEEEAQLLVDAGYPPALAEVEADRLVTRRYFASLMYQVAMQSDPSFAAKHSGLTEANEKMNALVEEGWLYSKTGRIYREEILSVLCTQPIEPPEEERALEVEPVMIMGAELESPASPI
ncbi:MAG: hypothetical protein R6V10_08910 [bacterium]